MIREGPIEARSGAGFAGDRLVRVPVLELTTTLPLADSRLEKRRLASIRSPPPRTARPPKTAPHKARGTALSVLTGLPLRMPSPGEGVGLLFHRLKPPRTFGSASTAHPCRRHSLAAAHRRRGARARETRHGLAARGREQPVARGPLASRSSGAPYRRPLPALGLASIGNIRK